MIYKVHSNCSNKNVGHPFKKCHLCGATWDRHNDHKCRDGRDGWFEDEVDPNPTTEVSTVAGYDPIAKIDTFEYAKVTGYHPDGRDVCHRCHKTWAGFHTGFRCHEGRGHAYLGPQPDPWATPTTQAEALGGATNMVINVIATRKVTKVDSATGEQTVVERLVVSTDIIAADANSAILIAGRKIAAELSDEDLSVGVTVKATAK